MERKFKASRASPSNTASTISSMMEGVVISIPEEEGEEVVTPKRQVTRITCRCQDQKHVNIAECEVAAKAAHISVMTKIICCSKLINIFIGENHQVFSVHQDLIALHSGYISDLVAGASEDVKISLPDVNPLRFADFMSWMYSGDELSGMGAIGMDTLWSSTRGDELWALGCYLKAPAFENFWMDTFREDGESDTEYWITASNIESVYILTKEGSALRRYVADLVHHENPISQLVEHSEAWKEWKDLLKRCPDLFFDLARRSGVQWNGTHPWDEQYRALYMEMEEDLEEKWKRQILAKRARTDVEKDAKDQLVSGILQLDHLELYSS